MISAQDTVFSRKGARGNEDTLVQARLLLYAVECSFFQRLLIQVAVDWRFRCRKVVLAAKVCCKEDLMGLLGSGVISGRHLYRILHLNHRG